MTHRYDRLLAPPRASFFLFGPRGTGKSTWVGHTFPTAYRIDLLDEARYQSYLARPDLFAAELRAREPGSTVCVDEVQRLPGLLNEVHRFMEERRLRFILCGSSARKLKREGTNLLAGRAVRCEMHPFLPAELGRDFDVETALRFGTMPVIWQAESRRDALLAYARLYLKEEIQAEAVVRNLPGFARFLPVAALFHAQTLSVASLARDAEAARPTVSGYVDILEDTLLAFRLPAYAGRMRVREKKHPKLYFVDAGIVRAIKQHLSTPAPEERGPLFEGWVANVLRAYRDYRELFEEWYYWAPAEAAKTEVDFLLRRGNEWLAVEAKAASKVSGDMLRGLRAVAGLKGLTRRVLVYGGTRSLASEDGIEMWPLDRLHRAVADNTLWP